MWWGELKLRVLENVVLVKAFGTERIRGSCNRRQDKLHTEELRNVCCSLNVVRAIKGRRTRWAGNVARMVKKCMQALVWKTLELENLKTQACFGL
jgi:hypothetical protein